jgi:type II secretory pathway predicted ATPase ExeA
MNNTQYFAFADFARALENLQTSFRNEQERYLLLTGDTGVGKTMLCRQLHHSLDRCRHRIVYFSHARHLNATGLIRVMATHLRRPTRRSHSETLQGIVEALREEPYQLLLWFDEAHELAEETLLEAKSMAESELNGNGPLRILFIGAPTLRDRLHNISALWRRIVIREELVGLSSDELPAFVQHYFGAEQMQRLCQQGMRILFERGRGVPGLIIPMFRKIMAETKPDTSIDPVVIDDILQRWELA